MKKISIIGDGGWGTALSLVLCENGHKVTVWGPFPEYLETIKTSRENKIFLPGVQIPPEIKWTADQKEATEEADIVILASPTKFFRPVIEAFTNLLPPSCSIISVAKGLDQKTHKRMTQVAEEFFPQAKISALSGPSHAEEVARQVPTAVVIASGNEQDSRELQSVFANTHFRVYTSDDVAGIEFGGALKNIVAIAVGISDGMGFGDNTRAALITRGLAEITRLGSALGAKASTFAGLSGMGDLVATCTSRLSRNRGVGERIGKGESMDHILGNMKQAAEGVWNCACAYDLANNASIDVPITREVYEIIHKGKNPYDAVRSLLAREMKAEIR